MSVYLPLPFVMLKLGRHLSCINFSDIQTQPSCSSKNWGTLSNPNSWLASFRSPDHYCLASFSHFLTSLLVNILLWTASISTLVHHHHPPTTFPSLSIHIQSNPVITPALYRQPHISPGNSVCTDRLYMTA